MQISDTRANLIKSLETFLPYNEQEEQDQALILYALKNTGNIFSRENRIAHMTASAWIVNRDRTKVLMAYHNIYDSWSWLGGHADGEENLLEVALRETREESGIKKVRPVSEQIFSVESLTVDGHEKNGRYVSSHLHLNITYLLEADETEKLQSKAGENRDVTWFPLEEAVESSSEEWFKKRIYAKLNAKLQLYQATANEQ